MVATRAAAPAIDGESLADYIARWMRLHEEASGVGLSSSEYARRVHPMGASDPTAEEARRVAMSARRAAAERVRLRREAEQLEDQEARPPATAFSQRDRRFMLHDPDAQLWDTQVRAARPLDRPTRPRLISAAPCATPFAQVAAEATPRTPRSVFCGGALLHGPSRQPVDARAAIASRPASAAARQREEGHAVLSSRSLNRMRTPVDAAGAAGPKPLDHPPPIY